MAMVGGGTSHARVPHWGGAREVPGWFKGAIFAWCSASAGAVVSGPRIGGSRPYPGGLKTARDVRCALSGPLPFSPYPGRHAKSREGAGAALLPRRMRACFSAGRGPWDLRWQTYRYAMARLRQALSRECRLFRCHLALGRGRQ